MLCLQLTNRQVILRGEAPRRALTALDVACSYFVAGFMFAPSYRSRPRRWDGKEHLFKFHRVDNTYRAPIGLLDDIRETLDEMSIPYEVEDARAEPARVVELGWNPEKPLRDYQVEAADAFFEGGGCGLLKLAIRAGKTLLAAEIMRRAGCQALHIVPSQMLLHQARADFAEAFQLSVEDIGIVGEGEWTVKPITVATIQTLSAARGGVRTRQEPLVLKREVKVDGKTVKVDWCPLKEKPRKKGPPRLVAQTAPVKVAVPMDPRYKQLVGQFGLVCFDEVHHLRGQTWHECFMDFNARYRLGLSATAYLENEREQERGVIWLKACCGRIRYEVSASDLIDEGHILRPTINIWRVREPDLSDEEWSSDLVQRGITHNPKRNAKVCLLARQRVDEGLKVLIATNRHDQVALLLAGLRKLGVRAVEVTGKERQKERDERVAAYVRGDIDVIVGTVFKEGVNIPAIECVINAEGGRDPKATMQRLRNLTKVGGKTRAVVDDFADLTNDYLRDHSLERLRAYRSERAFRVVAHP